MQKARPDPDSLRLCKKQDLTPILCDSLHVFIQFAGPPLRAEIFAGIQRALRPGGRLILQGYRPKQLEYGTGGPKTIANQYTAELLADAFADLEIRHLREHNSVVHEGSGHDGMSALVDLVAVKP